MMSLLKKKKQVCELGLLSLHSHNHQMLVFPQAVVTFPEAEMFLLTTEPMGDHKLLKGVNYM